MSARQPRLVSKLTTEQLALLDAAVAETHPGMHVAGAAVLVADRDKPISTYALFVVKAGQLFEFFKNPEAQAAFFGSDSLVIAFETDADFLEFMTLDSVGVVRQ